MTVYSMEAEWDIQGEHGKDANRMLHVSFNYYRGAPPLPSTEKPQAASNLQLLYNRHLYG